MKTKMVVVLIMSLAVLASKPAAAEDDFTLHIPIQIQNMHEQVNFLEIYCEIRGKQLDGTTGRIGYRTVVLPLDSNTGDVTISEAVLNITVDREVADPRDATDYSCTISYTTKYLDYYHHVGHLQSCSQTEKLYLPNSTENIQFNMVDETKPCHYEVNGSLHEMFTK